LTLGLDLVVADVAELGRAVVVDGFNTDNLNEEKSSLVCFSEDIACHYNNNFVEGK
jgi:hypothetical protein